MAAYGGWSMDDHHPAGFNAVKTGAPATIFHPAPSPYGIPYRSLYSRNITNLMFAGRNASCTHTAMSSTRVMGTGCVMGQAVGTAAALAVAKSIPLSGIKEHIIELQQTLLYDDAYLPGLPQMYSEEIIHADLTASSGDPEPVRNGINRPVGTTANKWMCGENDWIAYKFNNPVKVENVTVIVDSGLDQIVALSYLQKDNQLTSPPDVMPKAFRIEGLCDGTWQELIRADRSYQRLCRFPVNRRLDGIRFVLEKTWGAERSGIYSFYTD